MSDFIRATDYIVIAGPTASGKSSLALALARRLDGVIINADSMQIYADLHCLTARPSSQDVAEIAHRLYGIADGGMRFSVGHWLDHLHVAVREARKAKKWPILVGGTGFYIQAAIKGISPIPPIDEAVRQEILTSFHTLGSPQLHERLAKIDPPLAAKLNPHDSQRLIRALEVYHQTGTPLSHWQAQPFTRALSGRPLTIAQIPPRPALYQAIDHRFEQMMHQDTAVKEVKQLLARQLDPALPVMKALGVAHLSAFLQGTHDKDRAIELSKRDTRHYAKRQMTWLRHNFTPDIKSTENDPNRLAEKIVINLAAMT